MNNAIQKSGAGRPCQPQRIRVNAVLLGDGRAKHLFSVTTSAGITDVMKALQALPAFRAAGRKEVLS